MIIFHIYKPTSITQKNSTIVIGFLEILVMVLIISPLCLPEEPIARLEIVSIGVLSFFAQIAFVVAAKYENAASVALLRNAFNVIFAFLFQIVVFQVGKCLICLNLNNLSDFSFIGNSRVLQHSWGCSDIYGSVIIW